MTSGAVARLSWIGPGAGWLSSRLATISSRVQEKARNDWADGGAGSG